MNAIIFHTTTKYQSSLIVSNNFEGDKFQVKSTKKVLKRMGCQMFYYGYQTMVKKNVKIQPVEIDFDKYDEIYLVSPVWAGRVNAYMRQFLKEYPFKNKKVHIIGNCLGENRKYFDSFKKYIDESNEIVEKSLYIKGVKQ
jgi:menaquinone-dependent protoporphyrinogen IX oxidase